MLMRDVDFVECKAPQRESDEAPAWPSQGEVWSPNPVAQSNPSSRPASRVRSTPMWQAVLLAH
jgi:hypothetical protein